MSTTTSFLTAYQTKKQSNGNTCKNKTSKISAREREVLHLIAYEYSSKEIAAKLYLSYETVNSHRKNIMVKMGVKNTAGMVRVAFESGLMRVGQVACLILFIFNSSFGQSDPNNAGQYNLEIRTNTFSYGGRCADTELVPIQPAFLFKTAEDMNGTADYLMSFQTNMPAGEDYCHNWSEVVLGTPITTSTSNALLYLSNSESNPKVDLEVQSFNNNVLVSNLCQYNNEVFGTDCNHQREKRLIEPVETGASAQWNDHSISFPTNAACVVQSVWRCTNGDSHTSPLDFGTINLDDRSHVNSNRAAPLGSISPLSGYLNFFDNASNGAFDDSPDVVYEFTIINNAKKVLVLTDIENTNFNTKIHILWKTGGSYTYIATSNSGSNFVRADLGAGDYYAVVEGWNGETGDFRIQIPAPDAADVNAGTIVQPSPYVFCPGEDDWPGIASSSSASPGSSNSINLGAYVYQWQYQVEGEASWNDLPNTNFESLPSGLDNMTDNTFNFRRKVTIAGNAGYSNTVTISPDADPGSIALNGNATILPGEDPGQIISVEDGSGPAEPIFYSWFRSTNGTSFSNIFVNTSTYDVPELHQTTWYRRHTGNRCSDLSSVASNTVMIEVNSPYDCPNVFEINCGETISGNTSNATDYIETWCGTSGETGPEVIFQFQAYEDQDVEINLTGLTADLDLFLLDNCATLNCLNSSLSSGTQNESITVSLISGTYYIILDGFLGATSDFDLTLTSCGASLSDCNSNITLLSPVDDYNTGTQAKLTNLTITASNKLSGDARVTYNAENGTTLQNNFEISGDAELVILNDGCQ